MKYIKFFIQDVSYEKKMVFSKDCPFEGTLKRVFNTTLIGSLNIENLSDFKNVTFNYRITKKDSKDKRGGDIFVRRAF